MKIRGFGRKIKARKIISCLMAFMLFSLLWVAQTGTAGADPDNDSGPAASLSFRVGYSGESFTEVKVFADDDFANAKKVSYSFMDSLPSPVMEAVTGIPLTDLLSKAGIDFSKVKSFTFYCADVPNGPYKTLTKDFLYKPRYYYPNIMQCWNTDTQNFTDENDNDTTAQAVYNAKRVYPMMCISDNWVRGAMEPDFSKQDSSNKYRLVLGQLKEDPSAINAPYAAKCVYQIDVTLNGSPESGGSVSGGSSSTVSVTGVSLSKSTTVINAGSTCQLTVTVDPASAADRAVTWSSSDNAVATVSSTGLVTGVAPGVATITVTTADGGKTAACTVTVSPLSVNTPVVPQGTFNDIKGHWAENIIEEMVLLGGVNGYNDGSFKPENTITRAEFATILMKTLIKSNGMTLQEGKIFDDTKGHWAQEYITSAASFGIVSGYDANTFGPDELINREQMAVMLVKAINLEPGTVEGQFTDSNSISGWASDAVETAAKSGLMTGYPDHTFLPQANATRAEAVTAISNALTKNTK